MTENDATSPEMDATPPGQASETTGELAVQTTAPSAPARKKTRSQPILVWVGIACLLGGALIGWQVSERERLFRALANQLDDPVIQESPALTEWADRIREKGGPTCHAVADMLTSDTLPPLLKGEGVNNREDLYQAVTEGGKLHDRCVKELTSTWSIIAWVLAISGIVLILSDILRERRRPAKS